MIRIIHNRSYFFKYVTAEVAKLIIENRTLRWSSPLDFNDPFDHRINFHFTDNIHHLATLAVKRMTEIIYGNDDISFDPACEHSKMLEGFRKHHRNKISRTEFLRHISTAIDEMVQVGLKQNDIFLTHYERILARTRVLCVTECHDNILMWSHYCKGHTGAVFKLNVIDKADSQLALATQVRYSSDYPTISTEKELIDDTIGILPRIDFDERLNSLIYIKALNWAYEKEWRISIKSEAEELGNYFPEKPETFGAIYLGCRMEEADIQDILDLADKHLHHIEIWRAVPSRTTYRLDFNRIR